MIVIVFAFSYPATVFVTHGWIVFIVYLAMNDTKDEANYIMISINHKRLLRTMIIWCTLSLGLMKTTKNLIARKTHRPCSSFLRYSSKRRLERRKRRVGHRPHSRWAGPSSDPGTITLPIDVSCPPILFEDHYCRNSLCKNQLCLYFFHVAMGISLNPDLSYARHFYNILLFL